MAVYCLQIRASFSTAARRDNVLAAIQARISGKPRWGVDVLDVADLRPARGVNGLVADLRFATRADEEDVRTRVETVATGVNAPTAGSYLILHDCSHDEATDVCTVTYRKDW